jgi:hypothetical protein
VLRFARPGGENVFGVLGPDDVRRDTPWGDVWRLYGGHRLWHAPEHATRTYWPDNAPIEVRARTRTSATLVQPVERSTGLVKSIEVRLAERGAGATVVHRIENRGLFGVELAPWALSVMAPGGRAIVPNAPFVPFPEQLGPARPIVLWSYTRLDDPRFELGPEVLSVEHDPTHREPQKIGVFVDQGAAAYRRGTTLFLVRWDPSPGPHADLGSNCEIFVDGAMLELETLGPLARVAPGDAVTHVERWSLHEAPAEMGDAAAFARALAAAS